MTLHELVSHFEGVKRINSTSYQCKCPVHRDEKASLTVSSRGSRLLLHCHAGCDTKVILEAVGLSFRDLGNYTRPQWRERLEFGQKKKIEAVYDYRDEKGRYLYSKVRFAGKEIRYVTVDEKADTYQYCKPKEFATLYRLPELIRAIRAGYPVYLVEGEKDVDTLRDLGYTATTAGGVNDWKKEYAPYFTGAQVVILPDNDEPGLKLKDQIIKDLKHYAHSIRWTITSSEPKGDVTDYLKKEGHSKDELKELISTVPNIGAPWLYYTGKGEKQTLRINAGLLADSISRGLDYLIVRRPDEEKDDFYLYKYGVYKKCNRNMVKSIILRYMVPSMASDSMVNNVYGLLMCQERKICTFRDLDTDEHYINLKNGLYNIRTRQLEPHTPRLYSTIQLNCEYHPEETSCPVFMHFMEDLCSNQDGEVDKEKMAVIQEYVGIVLSNIRVYKTKLCLVLLSFLGNTGKTQLLNLVIELLGSTNVANIPIQNMNEESKFALGGIIGKRLISVGDQTSSEIKDSSIFKQLTGGDDVKVEKKGKQPFNYKYPGGIMIACNNLPTFRDDKGGHLFERLCVVPCINSIEQERRDSELLDKILKEKNAVFLWFLEGLHRLISNGYKVTKSRACEAAVKEYRSEMDTVFRYLSEFYIITGDSHDMVSKPVFDDNYIAWCHRNDYNHVNRQNIKKRMEANGCPANQGRIDGKAGVMVYRNLREKSEDFHMVTEYEQQEMPF